MWIHARDCACAVWHIYCMCVCVYTYVWTFPTCVRLHVMWVRACVCVRAFAQHLKTIFAGVLSVGTRQQLENDEINFCP